MTKTGGLLRGLVDSLAGSVSLGLQWECHYPTASRSFP